MEMKPWISLIISFVLFCIVTNVSSTTLGDPNWNANADINNDSIINLLDLAILGQAWGSSAGDANWNSNADINGDAEINLLDLATLGQTWNTGSSFSTETLNPEISTVVGIKRVTQTIGVGNPVEFSIMIYNVTDLFAVQFHLSFDTEVLECNSVTESDFLGTTIGFPQNIDNSVGIVTSFISKTGSSGVNGSGILVTIGFTVLSTETINFSLSNVGLIDSTLNEISTRVNSEITYTQLANFRVVPASQNKSLNSTATINISVTNVTDLYAVEFDLSFDPSVLRCDSFSGGSFLGATVGFDPTIDNTAGTINGYSRSRVGTSGVSGSGTIATIQFTGITSGTSALTFSGVRLMDSSSSDISFSIIHGTITVPSTKVKVVPASQNTTIGLTFTVNVSVEDVTGLKSVQFDFGFNADMLRCDSFTVGDFISGSTGTDPTIDNTAGTISGFSRSVTSGTVSGNGTLAVIQFSAIGNGTSALTLSNLQLLDSSLTEIMASLEQGEVLVIPNTRILVIPNSQTKSVNTTVKVNVTVANVTDLSSAQFDLSFDASILRCNSVIEGDFMGETIGFDPTIDNTAGTISGFGKTKLSGDADGTGVIAIIEFSTISTGTSPLTFSNVDLVDPSVSEIPASEVGGSITVILLGDITEDGIVNIYDLAILGQAWQSSEGDANWNASADLNNDGMVGLADLAIMGQNWQLSAG